MTPWQKMVKAVPSLAKKSEEAEKALKNLKNMKEETIGNTAGAGNIAGIGVGSHGEPGIKRGKFAGATTFMFKRKQFLEFQNLQKRDRKWWKTYLGENEDYLEEVRKYARRNPKSPIVFECEDTGHLFYVRYGKK